MLAQSTIAKPLGATNFFGEARPAGPSPIDLLDGIGSTQRFERDREIFAEGDRADHCYRVITGAVRTVKLLEDGRRQVIEFALPEDVLGFDLAAEHEFSAEAVTDTVVKCYPRRRVEAAAEQQPSIAKWLRSLAAEDLRRAHGRIVALGRKTASERIAGFLFEMAERTRRTAGVALELPMARSDIADHLGLTVETVCRTLGRLKRSNAIAVEGSRIAVSNWGRLEQVVSATQH